MEQVEEVENSAEMLSVRELAEIAGVSRRAVYKTAYKANSPFVTALVQTGPTMHELRIEAGSALRWMERRR